MLQKKWLPILLAVTVIAACFFPWITVESKGVSIGGFESTMKDFGKPGIIHCFLAGLYILLLLIFRLWSVRTAFFLSTLNIAWAIRNYLLLSSCGGGECPDKEPALYIVLIASVLMTIAVASARITPGTVKKEA